MKHQLLTIILLTSTLTCFSQYVMLEEDVNADTIPETTGPNLKNYWHSVVGYGFVVGETDGPGADVELGNSTEKKIAIRYKRKLSGIFSTGFDIGYSSTSFHIKQDSSKILPNNTLHDKERLIFNNAMGLLYLRTNFGKRGNYMGNYLDLSGYGEWTFSVKHKTKDEHSIANAAGASQTQVTNSGILYTEAINYGVLARIGFNKLGIYGKYRLSDLFKPSYLFPELPRITVGLEIAIGG